MTTRGPKSLYQNSLHSVHLLVEESCKNINDRYGGFQNDIVKLESEKLHLYLRDYLPNNVLDDLCAKRMSGNWIIQQTLDLRIHFLVYFHSNLEKFRVHSRSIVKGRLWTFWFEMPIQDPMWICKLGLATKLTYLDLKEVCSDEILEVVGSNCKLLQEIHMSYPPPNLLSFWDKKTVLNPVPLLTDAGMRCLLNCKLLRKIVRIENPFSECRASLLELIQNLPLLEFVTCSFIGALLNETNIAKPLPLTDVKDKDCKATYVQAIINNCPLLQSLSLCMKVSFSEAKSFQRAQEVISTLQTSSLNLKSIELENFTFDQFTIHYLSSKGDYLHTFSMMGPILYLLTYHDVVTIGKHCPNLRKLVLHYLYHDFEHNYTNFRAVGYKQNLFPKLEWLCLVGREWEPEILLPVCIENTKSLKYLALGNKSNGRPLKLDDIFEEFYIDGKFSKLETLHLYSGLLVSMSIMSCILKTSLFLSDVVVLEGSNWTKEEVICLRNEVKQISTDTILRFYLITLDQ